MFKGGVARNIVADTAEVGVEVRSADDAKLEREAEAVIEAFRAAAEEFGAELEFTKEYIPVAQLEEGVRFLTAVLKARTG